MSMHITAASQSTYFPTFSFSVRENPITQMICDFFAELFSVIWEFLTSSQEPEHLAVETPPSQTEQMIEELTANYRKRQEQRLERERESQGPTQEELKARLRQLAEAGPQKFAADILLDHVAKDSNYDIPSSLMTVPEKGKFKKIQADPKAREGLIQARKQLNLMLRTQARRH